jgi:hypothetical protein
MTSDAQKAAAKTIAAAIVDAAAERPDEDAFALDVEMIAGDVPDRVARRVLDNYQTALNPLLGPHGLRVASGRRISRTRR